MYKKSICIKKEETSSNKIEPISGFLPTNGSDDKANQRNINFITTNPISDMRKLSAIAAGIFNNAKGPSG